MFKSGAIVAQSVFRHGGVFGLLGQHAFDFIQCTDKCDRQMSIALV